MYKIRMKYIIIFLLKLGTGFSLLFTVSRNVYIHIISFGNSRNVSSLRVRKIMEQDIALLVVVVSALEAPY